MGRSARIEKCVSDGSAGKSLERGSKKFYHSISGHQHVITLEDSTEGTFKEPKHIFLRFQVANMCKDFAR